jgi:hypothetical protein
LEDDLVDLQEKSGKIERNLRNMKKHEEYLETVKEVNPDDFSEINDIVLLHDKLSDANQ